MSRPVARYPKALGLYASLILLAAGLQILLHASTAEAVSAPDWHTTYYMRQVEPSYFYSLGCAQGDSDEGNSGTQHTIAILDFGAMYYSDGKWWFSLFGGADHSAPYVLTAAENWAFGYYTCTGSDIYSTQVLAIGTNTSGGDVTTSAGRQLGSLVNQLNSYINSYGLVQVTGAGANDIEPESGWASYSSTQNWVNGYDDVGSYPWYNYGAASGCPATSGIDHGSDPCNAGWTVHDVWWVSWATAPAFPVPEIYLNSGAMATQWRAIARYSVTYQGTKMNFFASLTQYQACQQVPCGSSEDNTPSQGWTQLYNALNGCGCGIGDALILSTDIKWGALP
jgi:hypothetical protein